MYHARHTELLTSLQPQGGERLEFDHRGIDPPVRGNTDLLKREELDELEYGYDPQVRLFDMSVDTDRAEYTRVLDMALNGLASLRDRQFKWERDWPAPKVWLEWAYVYRDIPPHIQGRLRYGPTN